MPPPSRAKRWVPSPSAWRRVSWSVVDQGLSSMSNVALTVLVARSVSARQFGAFGIVIVVYQLCLGSHRALVTEPVLVYHGAATQGSQDLSHTGRSSLLLSSAMGLTVALSATLFDDALRLGLLVLGLSLPLLLLQDLMRYLAFRRAAPRFAFFLDAVWLLGQIILVAVLVTVGRPLTVASLAGVWCVGCLLSVVVGMRASGFRWTSTPDRWIRSQLDLGFPYLIEFGIVAGMGQMVLLFIAPLTDLSSVGSVRGALTFFGPINIVFSGLVTVIVPEGGRLRETPRRFWTALIAASVSLALCALALLVVGLALPGRAGSLLFGDAWPGIHAVLLPIGIAQIVSGAFAGATAGVRALRAARLSLRIRVINIPILTILPLGGAALFGISGFAWASATAVACTGVVWWTALVRYTRSHPLS